jgi:glycosyltransferase involved in cell wall biosynthesis/SAM-dependent methyltransferase
MTDRPRVDILTFNFFDWDGARVITGGAERYVLELARLVGALGAQPRIVQNANRIFSKVHAEVPVLGIPACTSMDLSAMSAGFDHLVQDAALVIASPAELATRLATPAPIIGINHGIHWDYPNNRVDIHDPGVDQRIVDAVLACRACVAVDTNFYNWIRCFDGEAASRIRYIPNFVDLDRFRATPKRFDGPRLALLFPRRLCAERGFRVLVEAFDLLLPRHPALELHLCGSGPVEDEAIARAFVSRHPDRIRWSQLDMNEMPTAYASSHVVLVPTVFAEGTSLSCIEAMATNNAIVTTAVGGLPNLVIDGHNGIIAAPGEQGLVEAIERLVGDRALIERLARNGLSMVPAFARERWAARWSLLVAEYLPSQRAAAAPVDAYRRIAWPFGPEGERDAALARTEASLQEAKEARAARLFAEQQLAWRDSELSGIRNSTGWAVLQQLYRIRFALFPKGSRREAAGKWLMHRARALQSRPPDESPSVAVAAPNLNESEPEPAPPALAHKPFLPGICNVCGQATRFYRDDPSLDRESLTCEHCRTTSRYRSIARGVLKAIAARTGIRADAIATLPVRADGAAFNVYDTQAPFFFEACAYPLPDLLRRCAWIEETVSSYRPDREPGELLAPGVVNQNLERLTFPNESFDLVVTSDVMEHVRLDHLAHAEIARVLKPGGIYVFTVPHFRDRREHFVRVQVSDPHDPSRDVYLTEPEYHGDANAPGGEGALSYRSYGTVLEEELAALGFDVEYSFANDDRHGIRNAELFYCVKLGDRAG